MEDSDETRTPILELTDLAVSSIGLVRRGSNRASPFYFIKSEDGGNDMPEVKEEYWDGEGEPPEGVETPPETLPVEPSETPPESPEDELSSEEFAEQLKAMQEDFTAKLKAQQEATEKFAAMAADERRTRRLAEFTDKVKTFSFAAEVEQFAEDLMALEDHDADLYGRWIQRLNALDEQVKQGGLFKQYSQATGSTESDTAEPFTAEVDRVRLEKFGDEDYHDGWVKAYNIVVAEKPELAARYARQG